MMGAIDRVFRSRRPSQERPLAAIIAGLWRNGEQGVWYDASDISTMFQDAAGTLPVYMPGKGQVDPPVGKILDKSGRGNHAYQTTTTSRPTLSARYNLLTATERLDISPWSALTSGASTLGRSFGFPAPDGSLTATRLDFSARAAGELCQLRQSAAIVTGSTMKPSVWLRADTPLVVYVRKGDQLTLEPVSVTTAWTQFFLTQGVASTTSFNFDIATYNSSGVVTPAVTVYAWGADLRYANDGVGLPPYQRVVDANTYDTAGFPLYLKFDGVDDWLQTASVDFSGTDKLFATAALRKLSDSGAGVVIELSAVSNSNNGSFALLAPSGATATAAAFLRGDTALVATTAYGLASPISCVLSGVFDIGSAAGSESKIRVNGVWGTPSGTDAGGGNFGSYPIYIGRRGGSSSPFNGRLYGVVMCGASTPGATIAKAERYLNQKAKVF